MMLGFFHMWSGFFTRRSAKKKSSEQLELDTRDQHFLEQVANTPNKEPMAVTLMLLAWTAGPVTLLTVSAATWISSGEFLPMDRVIYFLAYSAIAGLLGLLTKIIYSTVEARKESKNNTLLLSAIDRLPEIIYMVRDLRLVNLGPDNRRIESAGILLRKFDLGPQWIACAIEDLTGNTDIAKGAERIEIYRRAGLYNRMNDLVQTLAPISEPYIANLRQTHPRIANAMAERLKGQALDIHKGQPREPLFLERILAAIEEENDELITLPDVEHLLSLCFELLCGRSITYLKVEYKGGDWNLTKAIHRLEHCRNESRLTRARVYSRLRALVAYLNYIFPSDDNISSSQGLSTRALMDASINGINRLADEVNDIRRQILLNGRHVSSLQMRIIQLTKAMTLYQAAYDVWQLEGRSERRFQQALKIWQLRSKQWQSQAGGASIKRGLLISRQSIHLSDEEKIAVARELERWLSENRIRRYNRYNKTSDKVLTIARARELAIDMVLMLTPHLELHNPEIQRAIDSSPLSAMASLEPDMSPMTKAAYGKAMASAIEVNHAEMAEKLAQNLIRYYRVPLGQGTIDFLVEKYDASRARLEFIAEHESPIPSGYGTASSSSLALPETSRYWESSLHNARRTLEAHL